MSRFYFNYIDYDEEMQAYAVYDRQWSNSTPIAWCHDINIAEMLVSALNQFWERPQ